LTDFFSAAAAFFVFGFAVRAPNISDILNGFFAGAGLAAPAGAFGLGSALIIFRKL
jgi:hypothetical protein